MGHSRIVRLWLALLLVWACTACESRGARFTRNDATRDVFTKVTASVVAILNDDRDLRNEDTARSLKEMGIEGRAPQNVIDVSLRKEPTPHGTGFMIEGGRILTAAHVVENPDRLKITTRAGVVVDADLVAIDEVRDVAVLKPRQPLPDVPAIALAQDSPDVGAQVWAIGHTGGGLWALSWGITEGVASGRAELLGAHLLLHDAQVYPGFSGGPVIAMRSGQPQVVGINHAILFTGGYTPVATISSASAVNDIHAVLEGRPSPLVAVLAKYAKDHATDPHAELFLAQNMQVTRDAQNLTTASILGASRVIEPQEQAHVSVAGLVTGFLPGHHDIELRIVDPDSHAVSTVRRTVSVAPTERVGWFNADVRFDAKVEGRYEIFAFAKGKNIGHAEVYVEDSGEDDQGGAGHYEGGGTGDPEVRVIVAEAAEKEPLSLLNVRAGWSEWRYPQRVEFNWFARGSRGFTGTNVAISSFVLDDTGRIVGRGVGCFRPEIRPEVAWSCMGQGGSPLITKAGRYDVVFTLNDRPVAQWPMEALVRLTDKGALDDWLDAVKKHRKKQRHDHAK